MNRNSALQTLEPGILQRRRLHWKKFMNAIDTSISEESDPILTSLVNVMEVCSSSKESCDQCPRSQYCTELWDMIA